MDPLAEKYPAWSPYNYVMNNPLGMVDPDGKAPYEIIDPRGKRIDIQRNRDGSLRFSNNATQDVIRVANALNETQTGRTQLNQLIQSDVKIKITIEKNLNQRIRVNSDRSRVIKTTNGETVQGNFNPKDNYGKFVTSNGKYTIKEASIILYEGSIRYSISNPKSSLAGLTEAQALGAVAAHESVHASDKDEINADLQYEQRNRGATRPNKERKSEQIEKRVITEIKN